MCRLVNPRKWQGWFFAASAICVPFLFIVDNIRNQAEQELAGDGEATEKKKLEQAAQTSKQALDQIEIHLEAVVNSNKKVRRDQNEIEEQVREMFSRVDEREKEINRWRAKSSKVTHLKDKLEQAENLIKQISKYVEKKNHLLKQPNVLIHVLCSVFVNSANSTGVAKESS